MLFSLQMRTLSLVVWVGLALTSAELLREPLHLFCDEENPVELVVKEARVDIGGELQFNARVYHYDGIPHVPGPTISIRAGTPCQVTVVNELSNRTQGCEGHAHNDFHCADRTNLHLHGAHVSPYEDDVRNYIYPGERKTYSYHLGEDHLMGTHWYHAHAHGSTTLQVLGGMFGALLIEPAASYELPEDLQALYNHSSAKVLSLSHHLMTNDYGVPWMAFSMRSYLNVSGEYDRIAPGSQTIDPNAVMPNGNDDFYAVNGQFRPTVSIRPDDATLLRFIHASGTKTIELEIDDPEGLCEMKIIARDGVFHPTPYHTVEAIVMVQGTRSDVALRCSAAASNRTLAIISNPAHSRDVYLSENARQPRDVVMYVHVEAVAYEQTAVVESRPFPTSRAPLPSYYADLMDAPLSPTKRNVTYIRWFFGRHGRKDAMGGCDVEYHNEHGECMRAEPFLGYDVPEDQRYLDEWCLGDTVEISVGMDILGPPSPGETFGPHPWHMHVNHGQVVGGGDDTPNGLVLRTGEWRDTVPGIIEGAGPGKWKGAILRYRPHAYTGDVVTHCHILQHEDRGMMTLFRIKNCTATDDGPDDHWFKKLGAWGYVGAVAVGLVVVGAMVAAVMYVRKDRPGYEAIDETPMAGTRSIGSQDESSALRA